MSKSLRWVQALGPILLLAVASCSTVGRQFRSDAATLSQLEPGVTTPEDATRLLGSPPSTRQSLADGSMAWHWQRVSAGAYVGVTDNRYLVLQFTSTDGGASWTFARVLHSQNISVPNELVLAAPAMPTVGRVIGVFCERRLPNGDMLPVVTRLAKGGRAESAGWKIGDSIVSVDGVPVSTLTEVVVETQKGGPLKVFVLRRNEQEVESTIDFRDEGS